MCNSWLVWSLIWNTKIGTEIHGKVSQVFQNYDIIFGSQLSNHFQFFLLKAYPAWVIRIRINYSRNMPLAKIAF